MKKSLFFMAVAALTLAACQQKEPVQTTPELTVEPTSITAKSAGETVTIQVTSNVEWKATSSANWFTFEPESGNGNATITVTVSPNEAYKERKDAISINCAAKRVTVNITQEAAEKPVEPTETKITEIKSAEDFAKFAANIDQYEPTETVKLAADITIEAPVDSLVCNFDGQDHTINFTYEAKDAPTAEEPFFAHVGVFRIVKAAVKNLKTAGSIKANQEGLDNTYHVGGIAGLARSSASFENCTNGIAIQAFNFNTHHLGGIVGYTEPGVTITGCQNKANVTASYEGSAKASQLGGIVGHLEGSGQVISCTNDGDVSYAGGGTTRMGGICGYLNNLTEALFKDCTNNGTLSNTATGYSDKKWSYQGGISGYYGTPVVNVGHVVYEGCVNNGAISCDVAGTQLRARIGGINGHAGNSNNEGSALYTWELKNCTNNGDLTLKGASKTRSQIGGIQAYGEPNSVIKIDGCTNTGKLSCDVDNTNISLGGMVGGGGDVTSSLTNVTIAAASSFSVPGSTGFVGLIAGSNSAYTTAVTGKVGAATVIKGETTTPVSSANFATLLFGKDLGTGGNADGVTFAN